MHFNHTFRYLLGILFLLLLQPACARQTPLNIVTTIKPIHSLVAGITGQLSTPELLIDQLQSPHDYHMKPSDIKKMQRADIIIYAGPEIESFMLSILNRLPKPAIAFSQISGMVLLKGRSLHPSHDHGEHHTDGHTWLSTQNAKTFVKYLVEVLVELDQQNAKQYRSNAQRLLRKLDALHSDIRQRLTPLKDQPFLQFHDAFQYFENEFSLSGGHFFTTGTEHKTGIKQLRKVKQQMIENNIRCIFYEPPVVPPILHNLIIPGETLLLPLEPLGYHVTAGADLYFQLMDNITQQLEVCLKH